jgi:hypothetical protein
MFRLEFVIPRDMEMMKSVTVSMLISGKVVVSQPISLNNYKYPPPSPPNHRQKNFIEA